ncbi:MAG: CRISPR-associated ring nuclease [Myxococcota bacterium]
MGHGTFVLAVLGDSPSVLSELLWWMAAVDRCPLAGIEVWTTRRGAARLRDLVASEGWSGLQRCTGPLPEPSFDADPSGRYGFRVHVFGEHAALEDVRSERESAIVSATLHDRVRALRAELPAEIVLLGSLAGGRKTVSAALHTAFCLQGGPTDRLVHVLQDEGLERWLREQGRQREYAFPTDGWAAQSTIPTDQQVIVYDVPFPRLRLLVPRRLSDALERLSWTEVWPVLAANMGRHVRAVLRRVGDNRWRYEISDAQTGTLLFETGLGQRAGAVVAAMASVEPGASAADVAEWLDRARVGWTVPAGRGTDDELRAQAVRSAATAARRVLEPAIPIGLERFVPPLHTFVMAGIELDTDSWRP